MSSFIWGMIVCPTQRNSQMAGRELRDLLFSPRSSIVLLTVLHTDVHLGSAYTPLHFGLSLCNLLQHVWLPYPRWKGTSIALIWGIVGLYKCCIYREIKCRNFPSDPASYVTWRICPKSDEYWLITYGSTAATRWRGKSCGCADVICGRHLMVKRGCPCKMQSL